MVLRRTSSRGGGNVRFDAPGLSLGLAASAALQRDGDGVLADFTLSEGQDETFVLLQLGSGNDAGHESCPLDTGLRPHSNTCRGSRRCRS